MPPDVSTESAALTAGTSAAVPTEKGLARPGLWPSAAVVILSAVVCLLWLASSATEATTGDPVAAPVASDLARVGEADLAAALATMDGSAAFMAQFRSRATGCPRPLAWVSLVQAPGQPPARIRLRSGPYFSPEFKLTDRPVRVAIPYPAPYEAGHGTLTAMQAGGGAVVALVPPWPVTAGGGEQTHPVSWRTASSCRQPNG